TPWRRRPSTTPTAAGCSPSTTSCSTCRSCPPPPSAPWRCRPPASRTRCCRRPPSGSCSPGSARRLAPGRCGGAPPPLPTSSRGKLPAVPARPLEELVDPGWAKVLAPVAPQIAAMGEFLRAELAAGRGYLPAGEHVLRAFTQPLDDVRVLIVGQDPYPTPGH